MIQPENCQRCRKYTGLTELCRVDINRPLTYKTDCLEGKTELRDKIFRFLFDMSKGKRVEIINDEQRMHVYEFVRLHGYNEGVSISEDWKSIYKHKF